MRRIRELEQLIGSTGGAIVALSGGVDSSVVAALAVRVLADRALAITAISPALASGELDGARRVAAAIGIQHRTITTEELGRDGYRRNDRFRCYHCKTELYGRLVSVAGREGYAVVLSGANADDVGDWRPGLKAASEHGVRHPLLEAGVDKQEVREIARQLGVPSAEKPASPCLASRLPYGTEVSAEVLAQIDRAEQGLKALGYRVLRVRHYGQVGRIELAAEELGRALAAPELVIDAVRRAGYRHVEISRRPFRSGSLNHELGIAG